VISGPGAGAVYRVFDRAGVLLYVGSTADFGKRWQAHARKASWREHAKTMTVAWYGSLEEARQAEVTAIAVECPLYNIAGVPAEYLHVNALILLARAGRLPNEDLRLTAMLWELVQVLANHLAGAPEPAGDAEPLAQAGPLDPFRPQHVDPRRVRMREILARHEGPGIRAGRLRAMLTAESMGVARETVQRWLAADEREGLVRRGPNGSMLWQWVSHRGAGAPAGGS
jgi:hypothetical protein